VLLSLSIFSQARWKEEVAKMKVELLLRKERQQIQVMSSSSIVSFFFDTGNVFGLPT